MTSNDRSLDAGELLAQGRNGEEAAAAEFHQRYAGKLFSLVQRNLATRFSARFDAEDVVQSVMRTLFRQVRAGSVPPKDSLELWRFLSTVALNKVRNRVKQESAQKRDVSKTVGDADAIAAIYEPNEHDAVELIDFLEKLAKSLEPAVAQVLQMLLNGVTEDEITEQMNLTTRTIRRYKNVILERMQQMLGA